MSTHVEDLPEELLLRILDLLPERDLIETVPFVCPRWSRLSADFKIWENRTCIIPGKVSDSATAKFFSRKPALRSVHFERPVGDDVLRSLASHCPNITSLALYWVQSLTLDTLRAIARNCDQIRDLRVSSEILSCRARVREVALMPRLEALTFNSGYYEMQLGELGAGCARLRRLDVGKASYVRLGDLGAPLLRRLQELKMTWKSVSHDIVHCAESLKKLTLYDQDNCTRLDDDLAEDLQPLKALTYLKATHLEAEPPLLRALLQPLLQSLNLTRCTSLDDDQLLELCERCPLLEDLDLSSCFIITARGLSSMCRLRWLRRLCLDHCSSLGRGTLAHLALCGGLQELSMKDVHMGGMEPEVYKLLEHRNLHLLVFEAWSIRDLIPWEVLPEFFPDLKTLHLGEWKSQDTSLPERLKAAMTSVDVTWISSKRFA